MHTKEEALKKIMLLVERFDEQIESYKRADYNETQTRRDFIDPFWKALGWDVDNENGYAESYREVIHEDRVKVGGATKTPDYSFRLAGGKRMFFLEAKKPSIDIKNDSEPAYQIRRYGWSAKMSISVITDFEEFAIYDCSSKPKATDKASNGRIKYIVYTDYVKEFDFIWDTFSKERVLKGSFDKYIQNDKNKKGTTTVDHDFLQSLDKWRIELAKNIALRNKNITEDELNFVVQNTIDRIIFLRIAEDRQVERYGDLQDTIKKGDYYKNLLERFQIANQKYNSELFDFQKDAVSSKIIIDNKIVKNIVSELYYPICPYEFSVLSVEILGSAYEQFLGKQITLTKGGRAIIEEKPEVRKAGGVYYTPQYIVDYIVTNTIGKLIEHKTPKEVSEIKIVDPACGSGSFLIGAYQYLLSWHKDFYTEKGKLSKGKKNSPLTPAGELTTVEKKRILINNIYGVDLDSNAVEVSKLSLLLKCMEGETQETIEAQSKLLLHERILPTLDNNIKSGNSLIDLDYYDNHIDFGEERKIKPFSWQKSFPDVFKKGGFDCVIGNPPYVNAKILVELFTNERQYLTKSYKLLHQKWDMYTAFIEKSFSLLRENGLTSMIIPYPFINQIYAKLLRTHIIENHKLISVLDLSNVKIFKDAVVNNIVYCAEKSGTTDEINICKIEDEQIFENCKVGKHDIISQDDESCCWNLFSGDQIKIDKSKFYTLGDICFVSIGMVLNADEKKTKGEFIKKDLISAKETEIHTKKYIEAKNIDKYKINKIRYLEWGTSRVPDKIRRPTFMELYENPKILINKLGKLKATFDDTNIYCDQTIRIGVLWKNLKSVENNSINNSVKRYSTKTRRELEVISKIYNEKFLLGILNSNTGNYLLDLIRGLNNIDLNPECLKSIPIPKNVSEEQQKQIIKHVDLLLQLNKDMQTARLPERKEQIQARIGYCEDKVNAIVYELYGLSEEEIGIIEKENIK
jgi:predicted type IV restriction endonuclease